MEISCNSSNDVLIAKVEASRIDAAAAIEFKEAMRAVSSQRDVAHIVLDLCDVDFIDSSGLGAIVAVMKLMSPNQRLDLAGLTGAVEKVFKLTRMDSVFTIHKQSSDVEALHRAV